METPDGFVLAGGGPTVIFPLEARLIAIGQSMVRSWVGFP